MFQKEYQKNGREGNRRHINRRGSGTSFSIREIGGAKKTALLVKMKGH